MTFASALYFCLPLTLLIAGAKSINALPTGREHIMADHNHHASLGVAPSALLDASSLPDLNSPAPIKQKNFISDAKKQASLSNLQSTRARKEQEALDRHGATARTHKGKFYGELQENDKADIKLARQYFHGRATKARKYGDHAKVQEMRGFLDMLPTPSIERHPPSGPLSPTLAKKLRRAQVDRESRDRKLASAFMEKEFNIPRPVLQKGRKRKDLSTLDPDHVKDIERKRVYYEQKRQMKQQGATEKPANTATGLNHSLRVANS